MERLLGKELCVLAWAAETANDEQIPVICSKWAALRPEERWWLFSMTVAEAGLPEDTQRGWRRALFHALSDGEKPPAHRKRRRPADADLVNLSLFRGHHMTLQGAIMELSTDQIRALENGEAVPVTIEHTRCVILRTDIYERVQALLDIEGCLSPH